VPKSFCVHDLFDMIFAFLFWNQSNAACGVVRSAFASYNCAVCALFFPNLFISKCFVLFCQLLGNSSSSGYTAPALPVHTDESNRGVLECHCTVAANCPGERSWLLLPMSWSVTRTQEFALTKKVDRIVQGRFRALCFLRATLFSPTVLPLFRQGWGLRPSEQVRPAQLRKIEGTKWST